MLMLSPSGQFLYQESISFEKGNDKVIPDFAHHRIIIGPAISPEPSSSSFGGPDPSYAVLEAVDTRTDRKAWSVALGYNPSDINVDAQNGSVWVVAPAGRVTIYDTTTGRVGAIIHHFISVTTNVTYPTNPMIVLDTTRNLGFVNCDLSDPTSYTTTTGTCALTRVDMHSARDIAPEDTYSAIVATQGVLFVSDNRGNVYRADEQNGQVGPKLITISGTRGG